MLTSLFETPTVCAWSKKVIGTIDQKVVLIRDTSEIGSLAELRNQPKILRKRIQNPHSVSNVTRGPLAI